MAIHIHIHKKTKDGNIVPVLRKILLKNGTKLKYLGDNPYYCIGDDSYLSATLAEWSQAAREIGKVIQK